MAQIIWTEPALDDLAAIAAYIALDKPGAASRLVQQVIVRVEQLAFFPLSGGKPRELSGTPYRQLVINPLRVFYRVAGEQVFIVYARGAAATAAWSSGAVGQPHTPAARSDLCRRPLEAAPHRRMAHREPRPGAEH